MLPWPLCLSLLAARLLACQALSAELQEAAAGLLKPEASDDEVFKHLQALVGHIRAGDYRLVRPSPKEATAERQRELAEANCIPGVAAALKRRSLRVRAFGADLVTLLTTNNPENRAALGKAGVVNDLVTMAKDGASATADEGVADAAAEAAEAIWILAYSGGRNLVDLVNLDAASVMADLLLNSKLPRARMWAGAALGNIVAAYNSVAEEASEMVRLHLLDHEGLAEGLVQTVALGPVKKSDDDWAWPSKAHRESELPAAIAAWGAGQALKNLALNAGWQEVITNKAGVQALCKLKSSPDWLESMKGKLTLKNLKAECGTSDL